MFLSLITFTVQVFYVSFQPKTKLMNIGGTLITSCKILLLFSLEHTSKVWLIIENPFILQCVSNHLDTSERLDLMSEAKSLLSSVITWTLSKSEDSQCQVLEVGPTSYSYL